MGFRNFRFNILWRVAILFLLLLSLTFVLVRTDWIFTPTVIVILTIVSIVNLINFIEKTNRDFTYFLNAILHQDFLSAIPAKQGGKSFDDLADAYDLIIQSFRRITYQKEEHLKLVEAVVDTLQVGIVCFDEDGHVSVSNSAVKKLFGITNIHHINGLNHVDPFIFSCAKKLEPGEQQLLPAKIKGEMVQLSVSKNAFSIGEIKYQLLSFQNIRDALDEKETDAWQKLIRVLSHEIMNSATPILSLSESIKNMFKPDQGSKGLVEIVDQDDREDLVKSIDAIHVRSKGLIKFVDSYRDISYIAEPKKEEIDVVEIMGNVLLSLVSRFQTVGVVLVKSFNNSPRKIFIDPSQLEQVLINLLGNAIEELEGKEAPKIEISIFRNEKQKDCIEIKDNGSGISADNIENIFMPFYTTKKMGTGVGLSISRQIMFMNRGSLVVESTLGEGCVFRLEFAS